MSTVCQPKLQRSRLATLPPANSASRSPTLLLVCSLALLLVAQLAFKMYLEVGPVLSHIDFTDSYRGPLWKLLLPVTLDGGYVRWSSTVLAITTLMDHHLSAETTIFILSAVLTVVSFITSWLAFRSLVFTWTFSLCMAFGTQFNYAWVNSSCSTYYLLVAYAEVNLLSLYYLLARPHEHPRTARAFFVCSLLFLALSWETWLDYFAFLVLLSALGGVLAWVHKRFDMVKPLVFVAGSAFLIAIPYLAIRIVYGGNHNEPGSECELLFNYKHAALIVEDAFANVATYIYMALTTFVPPWFLGSNALTSLGEQKLIDAQNGYHPDFARYVPMHYHYLWHFQAGMVLAAFIYLTIKLLHRCWRRPSANVLCLTTACLLIWTGFSMHAIIKFRPYLSVPVLSYKATISILGVAVLLSLAVRSAVASWGMSRKAIGIVVLVWGVLLLGAFTRPGWQNKLLQKVGCDGPPDPIGRL